MHTYSCKVVFYVMLQNFCHIASRKAWQIYSLEHLTKGLANE